MDKEQLMIAALQQRIVEIVASYEIKIASLKVDITLLTKKLEDKEQ